MKNLILIISTLLIINNNYAQDSPARFWAKQCKFITTGSGKSLGLKLKFSIPCSWQETEGERPHVVKNFKYSLSTSASMIETITVKRTGSEISKDKLSRMYKQDKFKSVIAEIGTFISGRKLKIDGLECGEITFKTKRESPVATFYAYMIQYLLYYKDYTLIILYGVGAKTEDESKELFNKYKQLFQGLVTKTVIISQWE